MGEKNLKTKEDISTESTHTSALEVRSETRRRLLKAGAFGLPFMMIVPARPLFAQSIGSVEALEYGEYIEGAQDDILGEPSDSVVNPFNQDSGQGGYIRSRDPRSLFDR